MAAYQRWRCDLPCPWRRDRALGGGRRYTVKTPTESKVQQLYHQTRARRRERRRALARNALAIRMNVPPPP
jgi:hypothetical protein